MDPHARTDGHALPEASRGPVGLGPSGQQAENTTAERESRVNRWRIGLFTAASAMVLCLLFLWGGNMFLRAASDPFGREAALVDLATSLNGATAYHVSHFRNGPTTVRVDVRVSTGLSDEARGQNVSALQEPPAYLASMARLVQLCVYDEEGAHQMSMTESSKCPRTASASGWRPAWLPHWI